MPLSAIVSRTPVSDGASSTGEAVQFVTTCSDPDGWRNIHTIDFKLARPEGDGERVILWLQLDQDRLLLRFYDPATGRWSEGPPGADVVLASRYAELHLAGSRIQGHGPTDPVVDVTWQVVIKEAAAGAGYNQYLQIVDDETNSRGVELVGGWLRAAPTDDGGFQVETELPAHVPTGPAPSVLASPVPGQERA